MNRTSAIFTYVLTFTLTLAFASGSFASTIKVETFTYKIVGDLEIKADVHRVDDEVIRPVLVWIHGGALINGGRQSVRDPIREMFLNAGYAIVSIDYRLAPESKLPQIIEDLEDAFKWLRKDGPRLFNVDTSKIAVAGGSAGGCLTLTSGFRVEPPPTVLVSFYGYGDLIGEWYSTPSPHQRHNRSKIAWEEVADIPNGPAIANSGDREGNGGMFYNYCRQQGLWPKQVSGFDPHTEPEKFYPYMAVKNVTKNYPPTLMIHGTADTDVPYEQSVMMAEQFKQQGVPHKLISIQNGEHGFGGGDPAEIEAAYASVLPFVNRYMK
ncbi:MAG: alpha/beta hydrolase [Verrucomicrobia bacterium]|nr:alpha/beta hydrolase [Verrucomicrobiota bacterium]